MLTHGRGKLSLFFPLRRGGAAVYSRTSLFHAFGEETYFTRVLCRIVDILNLKTNKQTKKQIYQPSIRTSVLYFVKAGSVLMLLHSMSVNPLWTRVLVGCLGNEHMTILRVRDEASVVKVSHSRTLWST